MDGYKDLYDSLAKTVAGLEAENGRMLNELLSYRAKERQWEQEKANQTAVITQMLTQKNKEHNEILEENQRLREQLRQARSM